MAFEGLDNNAALNREYTVGDEETILLPEADVTGKVVSFEDISGNMTEVNVTLSVDGVERKFTFAGGQWSEAEAADESEPELEAA